MKRVSLCCLAFVLLLALATGVAAANERYLLLGQFGETTGILPAGWSVADTNGDTYPWGPWDYAGARGGPCLRYVSNPLLAADDWVFSPPLTLSSASAYTLVFKDRVTSAGLPHKLSSWIGGAPSPGGMVTQLFSNGALANTTIVEETVPFAVGGPGTYYLGFHCTSDPGMLALFLDDVRVTVPETELAIQLQLDKGFYDPGNNTYAAGEPIPCLAFVQNLGGAPLTVNDFLTLAHDGDPNSVLAFLVTGPSGDVPYRARPKPVEPDEEDFQTLQPGDSVFKYFDLNAGPYDFSTPGTYAIEAVYKNLHPNGASTAWLGRIVSAPVIITIE